jgi:putative ABC transport system permease protein
LEFLGGAAISGGPLDRVLDLHVVSGSLAGLRPGQVAAGHTGAPLGYSQILIDGASPGQVAALAASHRGLRVAGRQVFSSQVQQDAAQNGFGDDLILGVIAALAAVTMINTLAVATLERRRRVRLLSRAGATPGQIAGMFGWQALFVVVLGIAAGTAVCASTLVAVTRAATGSAAP